MKIFNAYERSVKIFHAYSLLFFIFHSYPYSSTVSPEVQQHSPFPTILVGNPESGARAFELAEAAIRNGFDGVSLRADAAVVTPGSK